MAQEKNYYEILGISPTAKPEQVRAAFKKRAIETHPDRHTREFQQVNEAYEVLKDPEQRAQYDRMLKLEHEKVSTKKDVDEELHAAQLEHELKKRDAVYKKIAGESGEGSGGKNSGRK